MAGPLKQFEINPIMEFNIAGFDVSFTNSSLWMMLTTLGIGAILMLGSQRATIIPSKMQALVEMSYDFIAGMIKDNVGNEGKPYFPFIFSLFMFILFGNLFGMIPYSFTITSHIIVTFALALLVFLGVTVIALLRHGTKFFGYFMPSGAPIVMAPLIIPIEVISYLSRPVSLSLRLFANMMAGHTMLKIFAGFIPALGILGGWIPLSVSVAVTGFEVLVAVLQAYVFTILTCLYLHDAIHLH